MQRLHSQQRFCIDQYGPLSLVGRFCLDHLHVAYCEKTEMMRALLLIGLIDPGFFAASMVAGQDTDVRVRLFAMAQFPLLREENFLRYPTGFLEYKLLTRWLLDKWRDRSLEYFDLVVIVENPGTLPVGMIELQPSRHLKIGERRECGDPDPPPRELAQWENSIPVETKTIDTLDANAAMSVWFGPFSADELWDDLRS